MIHFEIPKNQSSILKVIGVGGGGGNAVNYMHNLGIEGVDFVICNTDSQALALSPVVNKVQLGPHLTQGLGAGANPEIGKQSCEESLEDITKILKVNTRMAFITAGMGGGTGTGGAPVVSKICRDLGILTVGIVTTPFSYEGRKRMKQAQEGIDRMREHVDTILIISNDKLRQQFGNLPFTQAFAKADDILATAAKCITDVINTTGQINVDFADVCTVMRSGGVAILGSAQMAGENRAELAVEQALNSPLLNDSDIRGAKWLLLNITSAAGEFEHTMDEAEAIQAYVQEQAGDNCDVILGMGHDPNLGDRLAVTIIATGFNHREISIDIPKKEEKKIVMELGKEGAISAPAETAPVMKVDLMAPQLVEMPAMQQNHFPEMRMESFEAPSQLPEHITLQLSDPIMEEPMMSMEYASSEDMVIDEAAMEYNAPAPTPVKQESFIMAPVMADEKKVEIQLTIKNEEPAEEVKPVAAQAEVKIGERVLTEFEIEERRRFEEQKRALEERAERLRQLSFSTKSTDPKEDMENVPAYQRKNMKLDNEVSSATDSYYSGYTVGANEQKGRGFIQTINTFLDGKKPD